MPIDPAGPLTQFRTQIDQNEADIAQCVSIAEANANVAGAGYGGIMSDTPAPIATINSTWQRITAFSSELLPTPRDIVQDVDADGLRFNKAGVWNVYAKITVSFDDLNSGRALQMRLYNFDDSSEGIAPIPYFIGRDQEGVNLVFNRQFNILPAQLGHLLTLEINSTIDTFTNPVVLHTILQANYVGLYQGF
jgi:hypothetical protein